MTNVPYTCKIGCNFMEVLFTCFVSNVRTIYGCLKMFLLSFHPFGSRDSNRITAVPACRTCHLLRRQGKATFCPKKATKRTTVHIHKQQFLYMSAVHIHANSPGLYQGLIFIQTCISHDSYFPSVLPFSMHFRHYTTYIVLAPCTPYQNLVLFFQCLAVILA